MVATQYNGKYYREIAEKNGSVPYDERMAKAYLKYLNFNDIPKTTTTVNLRRGAGTKYEILKVLKPNTSLQITGASNDWKSVKVIATGQEGWIAAPYVK